VIIGVELMKYLSDKLLKILLILLFGFMNIGLVISLSFLLDYNMLVKEQLLEIGIIILLAVLFNYIALWGFSDDG
jgi:hypothetical protein